MGGQGGGIFKNLFSARGWKGPNSFLQRAFDPGKFLANMEDNNNEPKPPTDTEALATEAEARDRERRRIGGGASQSYAPSRRTNALSASIGKRTLGGGL